MVVFAALAPWSLLFIATRRLLRACQEFFRAVRPDSQPQPAFVAILGIDQRRIIGELPKPHAQSMPLSDEGAVNKAHLLKLSQNLRHPPFQENVQPLRSHALFLRNDSSGQV